MLKSFTLILLTAILATAQTQQPITETSKSGSITGKVIDERGEPLPNAKVSVSQIGAERRNVAAVTDRNGTFRVDGLESVPYRINVSMPAYISQPSETEERREKQYQVGDSVTFVLIKGGVITGTVTNVAGNPVIGVHVSAQMVRDSNGRRLARGFGRRVSTDDRGVYRIYGLPDGIYIVVAGSTDQYMDWGINPFSNDVPTFAPSSTRANAAEISVRVGEETSNIDIRYRGEQGRIISGTVGGPPIPGGFTVVLTSIALGGSQSNTSKFEQPGSQQFAFTGLTDGDYYVTLRTHLSGREAGLSESKLVRLRGADVDGIELTARPLGGVNGHVVLQPSKASECQGKEAPPFKDISVSAWSRQTEATKNQPQFIWSLGAPVSADETGNFSLINLAPAQYYFAARFPAKSWYLQSISLSLPAPAGVKTPSKPVDTTRGWTTIKSGDRLSGLTVTLAQGAASFHGQLIFDSADNRLEKWFAYLVPAAPEHAGNPLRFYGATVSREGTIQLFNLAPGRYWVLVQPAVDDALSAFRIPDETETRAKLRRRAEELKSEIELKPCQDLRDFKITVKSQ
ncbi:MAG TPA: carboxypeptidase-like regulatory domain-containing protein [Pyrinomonadaceae bacterium]|nr:carboxypeptidase-like regulatory domain-containing protein [Pyrinomonadaceae bacterium]